jgi:hypothetical protein
MKLLLRRDKGRRLAVSDGGAAALTTNKTPFLCIFTYTPLPLFTFKPNIPKILIQTPKSKKKKRRMFLPFVWKRKQITV